MSSNVRTVTWQAWQLDRGAIGVVPEQAHKSPASRYTVPISFGEPIFSLFLYTVQVQISYCFQIFDTLRYYQGSSSSRLQCLSGSIICQGGEFPKKRKKYKGGMTAGYGKGTEIIDEMGQKVYLKHVVMDLRWCAVTVSSMGWAN